MDNKEIFARLARVNAIKREANNILEEIPFLIEYLDWIYPSSEFENRLKEFEEELERIDNV